MTKPQPPYYVVIFRVASTGIDSAAYDAMDQKLNQLVSRQPGYLGAERSTDAQGRAVSLLYFTDTESIRAWKNNPVHREARRHGKDRWLATYDVQIARVEQAYTFRRTD